MKRACVIGAGFGGLALAIRLQSAGIATTLIEARDKPGGRAYVWEREGFIFDAGPTVITDPACLAELWALSGHDIAEDVTLMPVMPFYRLNWADGTTFDYSNDEPQLRKDIARISAGDLAGYDEFLRYSAGVYEEGYVKLGAKPFLDFASMISAAPALAKYQAWRSVYSIVSSYIKHPKLREAFSFHTLLVGGNPMTTSAIYALIHKLEKDGGVWFAKGGTGRLIAGMVTHFERLGGAVRLHDPVVRIHTLGDRVTEVETQSGWRERFDAVASNADIVHSYRDLLGETSRGRSEARRLANKRFSPSLFVVHFGVEGTWPGIAHHTILFGPRYRALLQDIYEFGVLPQDFSIYLHHPTVDRSEHGAAGQEHVLRADPGRASRQAADRLGTGRPAARTARARRGRTPADPRYPRPDRHQVPLHPARFRGRSQRLSRQRFQPRADPDAERLVPLPQSRQLDPQPLPGRRRHPSRRGHSGRGRQRQGHRRVDAGRPAMRRIAVYCGSATPADPRYVALAREVGRSLARRDIGIVYGGGRLGLMGALAGAALAEGGEVIGVIPEALVGGEVANRDCTELHVVPGMHARKLAFTDLADGFLTLPGGVGTMDELWEAVSWAQLGYHAKPVGLLNAFGFFDLLLAFNRHMAEVGFVRPAHRGILIAEHELDLLLDRMAAHEPATPIVAMRAQDL